MSESPVKDAVLRVRGLRGSAGSLGRAAGSIEHAQLVNRADVGRMAALGLRASVQPAHLLDDRDVTERLWPGRAERCFPLRWMLDDGVDVVLGSDAPVSPLDPWLAIAAAVHRSGDDRELSLHASIELSLATPKTSAFLPSSRPIRHLRSDRLPSCPSAPVRRPTSARGCAMALRRGVATLSVRRHAEKR